MKHETDAMINERLRKPFEDILERMHQTTDTSENMEEIYKEDSFLTIGYLDKTAKIYICPETYEIIENACTQMIEFIDEQYPKKDPIGEHIVSYEWIYTGGGIYIIVGKMTDGNWFNSGELDELSGESFQIFRTRTDAEESLPENVINEIYPSKSKEDRKLYAEMWREILRHEEETDGEMSEKLEVYTDCLIDNLANV